MQIIICFQKGCFAQSIRILNVTIKKLRFIEKGRNIDGYKNTSKKRLEDLFTKPKRPKTSIPIPRP